jgi:hypothetical protein
MRSKNITSLQIYHFTLTGKVLFFKESLMCTHLMLTDISKIELKANSLLEEKQA